MGLFDGPALKFAQTFREYLDTRIEEYHHHARQTDGQNKTVYLTVALCLTEISNALKHITE